jgi:hypothetical protein
MSQLVKMLGQSLYTTPPFGTENRNPNHRYAMQPIVLKIVNADGFEIISTD